MPTWVSSCSVRARAIEPRMPLCSCRISPICASMVCSGLSEVIGSWKMIEMSLPRIPRISFSDRPSSSRPLKRILPEGCDAVGYGNQRHALAALDLERDAVERDRRTARLVKRHREVADAEQWLVGGIHALL